MKLRYLIFVPFLFLAFKVLAGQGTGISYNTQATIGANGADGATGATGPQGSLSTFTYTYAYPGSVMNSTVGLLGLSGCWDRLDFSTLNVVGLSAYFMQGSTVGFSWINLVVSTGGTGSTVMPMFPRIEISTSNGTGYEAFSVYRSTVFAINAFSKIGVQVSSSPASGTMPRGLVIKVKASEAVFVSP